ncbi:MAG: hypothetical protein FWE21_05470 [Defluviitaleaceae bacterium]|nr:hypothetical protein [Defluviitaleaceae bacterium]
MRISPQQTEKLLKGKQAFTQFGFSMMLTRLRGGYEKNPSPSTITASTTEINTFLAKFERIMAEDFATIQSL